jgi:hypothetical protein
MTAGFTCDHGLRTRIYHILSGGVLAIWDQISGATRDYSTEQRLQVVRLRLDDGRKIIGTTVFMLS